MLGRPSIPLKTARTSACDPPPIHRTLPRQSFHRPSPRPREKRGQKVKSASFVKQQKQKKPELCVSVDNEMNATTGQESCFSSDYLIQSLIFAYKHLLSCAVSSQISPFLSYMTGNKAVSHACAGRYKLHIAAERRTKKTKRIPRINHDLNIRFNRHRN